MITKDAKRILVADDSMFYRTQLSDILVEAGHRVRVAKDGVEVIKTLKTDPGGVDLLVLDIQMPNIDGFGVLEWLSENKLQGRFPVLMLTGVSEPDQILGRVRDLGASGIMTKDFTPEQLVLKINRLLFPEKISPRVARRVPVSAPVDFSVGAATYSGFLRNISSTGAFLHVKEDLIPGSEIHLRFHLPGNDQIFDPVGVVKWSTRAGGRKNFFGGCGISFTSMSEVERRVLKGFINSEIKRFDMYA